MTQGGQLLELLIKVSEKAANIARACRQDKKLFTLLVQEKSADEKNPRFIQDFKTLADVLIQETIKHDIGLVFPELIDAIKGEENNVFSNTLGETITVRVCSSREETAELLTKVLDGDDDAAKLLSSEVHKDIDISDIPIECESLPSDVIINISDIGIWIDPIDSTADYIEGKEVIDEITGLNLSGLGCVTVLIGAYYQSSGLPVVGVVNQPFSTLSTIGWTGKCYWGFISQEISQCSIQNNECDSNIILISRSEEALIKSKLEDGHLRPLEAAGAGHKLLQVALGRVAGYITSKGSTFRWDVCGPHAILRAFTGDVLDFKKFVQNPDGCDNTIKYSNLYSETCNKGGIIAFRKKEILEPLKNALVTSP